MKVKNWEVILKVVFSSFYKIKRETCRIKQCDHYDKYCVEDRENLKGIKNMHKSRIQLLQFEKKKTGICYKVSFN